MRKERIGIHAATLDGSKRLQRVWSYLHRMGPKGATTRAIVMGANVMAVSACVSELRAGGEKITCEYERGNYRYRLAVA